MSASDRAGNESEKPMDWRIIQNGDPDLAERCCVDHVKAAAVAALSVIEPSSASNEKRSRINNRSLSLRMAVTRVPASS